MNTIDPTDSFNSIERVSQEMADTRPDLVVLCKAFGVGTKRTAQLQMHDRVTDTWYHYHMFPKDKWETEANAKYISWFNQLLADN